MERYVLRKLFARFDQIQEYLFLVTVGWCLGVAALAECLRTVLRNRRLHRRRSDRRRADRAGHRRKSAAVAGFLSGVVFLRPGRQFQPAGVAAGDAAGAVAVGAAARGQTPGLQGVARVAGGRQPPPGEIGVRLGTGQLILAAHRLHGGAGQFLSKNRRPTWIQLATLFTFIASSYWHRAPVPDADCDLRPTLRRD